MLHRLALNLVHMFGWRNMRCDRFAGKGTFPLMHYLCNSSVQTFSETPQNPRYQLWQTQTWSAIDFTSKQSRIGVIAGLVRTKQELIRMPPVPQNFLGRRSADRWWWSDSTASHIDSPLMFDRDMPPLSGALILLITIFELIWTFGPKSGFVIRLDEIFSGLPVACRALCWFKNLTMWTKIACPWWGSPKSGDMQTCGTFSPIGSS